MDPQTKNLAAMVSAARVGLRPQWTDERGWSNKNLMTARQRKRIKRRRNLTLTSSFVLLAVAGGLGARALLHTPDPVESLAATPNDLPSTSQPLALDARAHATPLSTETRITVEPKPSDPAHLLVSMNNGAAAFSVVAFNDRVVRIESQTVWVEVMGATFVMRQDAGRLQVVVTQGQVSVGWPDGHQTLNASEDGWFPPRHTSDAVVVIANPRAGHAPSAAVKQPAWQGLARAGAYKEAFALLRKQLQTVSDNAGDLLLAADAARLSGHPQDAVAPLSAVLNHHRTSPQAALAAFTLGRVYMDQLKNPQRAAEAFADAYSLDAQGALREQALARQAQALCAAGHDDHGLARIRTYLARFPRGQWSASLRDLSRSCTHEQP